MKIMYVAFPSVEKFLLSEVNRQLTVKHIKINYLKKIIFFPLLKVEIKVCGY